MRLTTAFIVLVALAGPPSLHGQTGPTTKPAEPFKVGTFDIHGVPRIGLVLRDSLVVDIEMANRALQTNPAYVTVATPKDMLELIGQYEYGLKYRLYEIVNDLVANN